MTQPSKVNDLDRLKSRIAGLRAKTIGNGCTEDEAMSAAAKVAELLDRYNLTLSDVDLRNERCVRVQFETGRKRRNSLAACISAIADFCDCRAWRESDEAGQQRYVFFGLKHDVIVADYLCDVIDTALYSELARYKETKDYQHYVRRDRTLASNSFLYGMAMSISAKLSAVKAARDQEHHSIGRALVIVKQAIVEDEFAKLGLRFKQSQPGRRLIVSGAHDAGNKAGEAFTVGPGIDRQQS